MIFTRQRHPAMKTTPCLPKKWRLLAWLASPSSSAASHFFSLRIRPSWSDIFSRRRISFLNSGTDKFLGRLGKIEGLFISNPKKDVAYILSNLGFFCLLCALNIAPFLLTPSKHASKDAHFKITKTFAA